MQAYRISDEEPLKIEATPSNEYLYDDLGPLEYILGDTKYIVEEYGFEQSEEEESYSHPFLFWDDTDAM